MDLNDVLTFFDGSIFPDELRGDFSKIQAAIEELNEDSTLTDPPESRARNALLNAIFSMLKGNLTQSWTFFEELRQIPDLPARWPVRVSRYEALWHSIHRYPSATRFFQEMGGFSIAYYSKDFQTTEHLNSCAHIGLELVNQLSHLDQLEICIIGFTLLKSLNLWNMAFLQHPRYPEGPWSGHPKNAPGNLRRGWTDCKSTNNCPLNSIDLRFIDTSDTSKLRCIWEQKGAEILEEIQRQSAATNDVHGLALSKMLEADNIISASDHPDCVELDIRGEL
jgi:hypothetical protein